MSLKAARFTVPDIMSLVSESPRYDLAESVGPNLTIGDLYEDSELASVRGIELGYGTAQGSVVLRDLIAQQSGQSSDHIVTTMGGMHALFLMSMIVCDKDAHVLTARPQFPLATQTLHLFGANVETVRCRFEQRYSLPVDEIVASLKTNTRLVCIASPQNPSGVLISADALSEICESMQAICPGAYLLVDETYREACYGDTVCTPSAAHLDERIVCVTSLSKCHGAPGLRSGWISTADKNLRDQLIAGKFQSVISSSAVDEAMAIRVMQASGRIIQYRRSHLQGALDRVEAWVQSHPHRVEWVKPDRGALCCISLVPENNQESDSAEFYQILGSLGVRVAPGQWFGDETHVFRLGFGFLSHSDLDAALSLLSEAIQGIGNR